jgi:hypothetical protein
MKISAEILTESEIQIDDDEKVDNNLVNGKVNEIRFAK